MATGTGNLPYPGKVYNPFDILTAEELNEDVANIESLADGTGIGDEAVTTAKIDDGAVTPEKLSPAIGFKATRSSSQGISGSGGFQKINLNQVAFDEGSNFDTGNNRYVAPLDGLYHFEGQWGYAPSNGNRSIALLYVNGSAYARDGEIVGDAGANEVSSSATMKLEQGDYVELYGWSSGNQTVDNDPVKTFLSGFFIGVTTS